MYTHPYIRYKPYSPKPHIRLPVYKLYIYTYIYKQAAYYMNGFLVLLILFLNLRRLALRLRAACTLAFFGRR